MAVRPLLLVVALNGLQASWGSVVAQFVTALEPTQSVFSFQDASQTSPPDTLTADFTTLTAVATPKTTLQTTPQVSVHNEPTVQTTLIAVAPTTTRAQQTDAAGTVVSGPTNQVIPGTAAYSYFIPASVSTVANIRPVVSTIAGGAVTIFSAKVIPVPGGSLTTISGQYTTMSDFTDSSQSSYTTAGTQGPKATAEGGPADNGGSTTTFDTKQHPKKVAVGVGVGLALFAVILAAALFWLRRHKKKIRDHEDTSPSYTDPAQTKEARSNLVGTVVTGGKIEWTRPHSGNTVSSALNRLISPLNGTPRSSMISPPVSPSSPITSRTREAPSFLGLSADDKQSLRSSRFSEQFTLWKTQTNQDGSETLVLPNENKLFLANERETSQVTIPDESRDTFKHEAGDIPNYANIENLVPVFYPSPVTPTINVSPVSSVMPVSPIEEDNHDTHSEPKDGYLSSEEEDTAAESSPADRPESKSQKSKNNGSQWQRR